MFLTLEQVCVPFSSPHSPSFLDHKSIELFSAISCSHRLGAVEIQNGHVSSLNEKHIS